ncbi:MAG: lipopolysaccharide export system protein LptA [Gammaproteobacteria bacterium]|jgi:lipopolysaccharide export system protein LptA
MKLILLVSAVFTAIFFATDSMALASDSEQPLEIEADFAELDDQEGKTVYIGNVVVTQGSIKMTGDKLRVNFAEDRELEDVFIEGQPAYFKQTPDSGDDVEGEGLVIEYHALESLLHLIQKAKLTQGERVFTGDRINYDTEKSLITAHGSPKTAVTVGQPPPPRERVRIIIPPKKKKPESP